MEEDFKASLMRQNGAANLGITNPLLPKSLNANGRIAPNPGFKSRFLPKHQKKRKELDGDDDDSPEHSFSIPPRMASVINGENNDRVNYNNENGMLKFSIDKSRSPRRTFSPKFNDFNDDESEEDTFDAYKMSNGHSGNKHVAGFRPSLPTIDSNVVVSKAFDTIREKKDNCQQDQMLNSIGRDDLTTPVNYSKLGNSIKEFMARTDRSSRATSVGLNTNPDPGEQRNHRARSVALADDFSYKKIGRDASDRLGDIEYSLSRTARESSLGPRLGSSREYRARSVALPDDYTSSRLTTDYLPRNTRESSIGPSTDYASSRNIRSRSLLPDDTSYSSRPSRFLNRDLDSNRLGPDYNPRRANRESSVEFTPSYRGYRARSTLPEDFEPSSRLNSDFRNARESSVGPSTDYRGARSRSVALPEDYSYSSSKPSRFLNGNFNHRNGRESSVEKYTPSYRSNRARSVALENDDYDLPSIKVTRDKDDFNRNTRAASVALDYNNPSRNMRASSVFDQDDLDDDLPSRSFARPLSRFGRSQSVTPASVARKYNYSRDPTMDKSALPRSHWMRRSRDDGADMSFRAASVGPEEGSYFNKRRELNPVSEYSFPKKPKFKKHQLSEYAPKPRFSSLEEECNWILNQGRSGEFKSSNSNNGFVPLGRCRSNKKSSHSRLRSRQNQMSDDDDDDTLNDISSGDEVVIVKSLKDEYYVADFCPFLFLYCKHCGLRI